MKGGGEGREEAQTLAPAAWPQSWAGGPAQQLDGGKLARVSGAGFPPAGLPCLSGCLRWGPSQFPILYSLPLNFSLQPPLVFTILIIQV